MGLGRFIIYKFFDFRIKGSVDFVCDRCQELYTQLIEGSEKLIVKFSDHESVSNDEIVVLPVSENKIDLSQHVFEYMLSLDGKLLRQLIERKETN